MVIAVSDSREGEMKKVVDQVAEVCLSKEFNDLRKELENVYLKDEIDNALLTAFQDALYSILTEREELGGEKHIY
ncbi:hypothetical protein [Phosphitispora fastidiosa]|uniref:hypothetical protein n=1 Tax=Phosphitispora fastidiosa TaxID=2837202 RepID=UPI001E6146DD|nr:hypothetical protein [Phosphitispora fastidiosa]MBU7005585.1 hypothetical protein [Phosphitispora fastidiosa]